MGWTAVSDRSRFTGILGSCRPNTCRIAGSFEIEPIISIFGSGDATVDSVIISRLLLPKIFGELRTVGLLGPGGLGSFDNCST